VSEGGSGEEEEKGAGVRWIGKAGLGMGCTWEDEGFKTCSVSLGSLSG